MQKNIIFFSHNLGQLKKGVSRNNDYIYNFLKLNNNNIYNVNCSNNFYRNIHNLYIKNQKIYGNKINIGGDHSMAISTISQSLNTYNNLKVVWIDAHPDINTYKSSITKNYHGMPLSFLCGLDYDLNFRFINRNLKFSNLIYIGLRDIDEYEMNILNKYNIKQITINDIRNDLQGSIKLLDKFIGNNHLHVSFDVDVLDPAIMPCTGTISNNGLLLDEATYIIDYLNKKKIVNMDISELNLEIGNIDEKIKSLDTFFKIFKNTLNIK